MRRRRKAVLGGNDLEVPGRADQRQVEGQREEGAEDEVGGGDLEMAAAWMAWGQPLVLVVDKHCWGEVT